MRQVSQKKGSRRRIKSDAWIDYGGRHEELPGACWGGGGGERRQVEGFDAASPGVLAIIQKPSG